MLCCYATTSSCLAAWPRAAKSSAGSRPAGASGQVTPLLYDRLDGFRILSKTTDARSMAAQVGLCAFRAGTSRDNISALNLLKRSWVFLMLFFVMMLHVLLMVLISRCLVVASLVLGVSSCGSEVSW